MDLLPKLGQLNKIITLPSIKPINQKLFNKRQKTAGYENQGDDVHEYYSYLLGVLIMLNKVPEAEKVLNILLDAENVSYKTTAIIYTAFSESGNLHGYQQFVSNDKLTKFMTETDQR